MHQTNGQARRCCRLQGTVPGQGADIIDHARTRRRTRRHHLGRTGIQGNHRIKTAVNNLKGAQHPVQFFLHGNPGRTGPGGFTTNIQDRRTGGHHGVRRPTQGAGIQASVTEQYPAIGKGIWSDVKNAHHPG